MKKRIKSTNHGKIRICERINTSIKTNKLSSLAFNHGKNIDDFKGKFYLFLKRKSRKYNIIKILDNNKLITVYPIISNYLPIQQYEVNNEIDKIELYIDKPIIIKLKNGEEIKGFIDKEYKSEYNNKFLLNTENDCKFIKFKFIYL